MIGLSGLDYKILELSTRWDGYSVTMNGPWWMKLLYDFGILQIYIKRLVDKGLLEETRTGWQYIITVKGAFLLHDYIDMALGNR